LLPYNDCGFLNIYPFFIIILFIFRVIFLCKNPGFTSQNKILTNTTFTTDSSIFLQRKHSPNLQKKLDRFSSNTLQIETAYGEGFEN